MPDVTIIRGDAYAILRPLFTHQLVDSLGQPFDLSGCTVLTTFKLAPVSADEDPDDESAAIKGTLVVDISGTATTQDKLIMVGDADQGTIELQLDSAATLAIQKGVPFGSDVRLIDTNDEPYTWKFLDKLTAEDSYTTRFE